MWYRTFSTTLILISTCMLPIVHAACLTVDISTMTTQQRSKLPPAASLIQTDAQVAWQNASAQPVGKQADATQVSICANVTTGITLAALQSNITTILNTQVTEDSTATNVAATKAEATTEVSTNDLCTATLAEVNARIDVAKAAIQADIDAATNIATAKIAMTTMNNQYAGAFKKVARCVLSRHLTAGQ